jgi:hypothetical protein
MPRSASARATFCGLLAGSLAQPPELLDQLRTLAGRYQRATP